MECGISVCSLWCEVERREIEIGFYVNGKFWVEIFYLFKFNEICMIFCMLGKVIE